ncbi:LysR family transcriptional regulator [Polaromonas sp. UC242_47]|uniref:LysR family transcriptional regulator n=1 Tax=Polaromonas sp. UC242_47 TaxID=3374626 RepID=UPI0037AA095A
MIGSLTLDQLRVLVTIADAGSFSAASRELRRAQSAISQAVANLEGLQGVELFDRRGHRPRLTEVGRVLVDQARLVLASATRFEAVAASTRAGVEPDLTIAIDPLVPTAPLIDSLRALSETFPDLPVHFSTEGLGGSLRRLRGGSAAMALCLLLPGVPEDIAAYPLLRAPMRAVVAPGHPLASLGRPATESDLAPHVQLVLSDPVDPGSANYGVAGPPTLAICRSRSSIRFPVSGIRLVPHARAPRGDVDRRRGTHGDRDSRRSDASRRSDDLRGAPT